MSEWFNSLEQRERRLIMIGGGVLAVLLIYVMLWQPFIGGIDKMEKSTQKYEKLVSWMEEHAAEVKLLQASLPRQGGAGNQSILGIIDKTAKQNRLGNSMKRVQPEGDSKARVWLDNAQFDVVVRWLEGLQRRQGIRVVNSSVEKLPQPGMVNVRLLFEK